MTRPIPPQASTPRWPGGPVGPHGDERVTCVARAKATGERCQRMPVRGATVCWVHGAAAPAVRAAAARRVEAANVERDVRNVIAFESLEGIADPLEALSRLANEAVAMKEALAARVNELSADGRLRYKASGAGTEQLRAEVALYERALDRSAKFLDLLAKSGFEERRLRVTEETGELFVTALRVILTGMLESVRRSLASGPVSSEALTRLEDDWRVAVGQVVPPALRALSERTGS